MTGFTRGSLDEGIRIETVTELLQICFMENTVVGFGVRQDLNSIGVQHSKIEELQHFFKDKEGQPYKVKLLAEHFLQGKKVQEGSHSAITDARVHLALYKVKQKLESENPHEIPYFDLVRAPKEPFPKGVYCTCKKK